MNNSKLKILMSGGGTGGHIFPAVAIANEIKSRFPNAEFLFVGANGKMEMEKVPQAAGFHPNDCGLCRKVSSWVRALRASSSCRAFSNALPPRFDGQTVRRFPVILCA